MDILNYLIKENGQPHYVYYDRDGYLFFSYMDNDGFEYLCDKKFLLLEIDRDDIKEWEKKCENILKSNGVESILSPIEVFYYSFLQSYYSGSKSTLMMSDEEQIELYNKIKKYESDIKKEPTNKKLIIEAIQTCEYVLAFISDELKKDRDFAIEVVKNSPLGILLMDSSFQDDKELALESVKINGLSIGGFSERLKNDLDIAIAALKNDEKSYEFIGDKIKKDEKFVMAAKQENLDLEYIEETIENTKNVIDYLFHGDLSINEKEDIDDIYSDNYNIGMYGLEKSEYDILSDVRWNKNNDLSKLSELDWNNKEFVLKAIKMSAAFLEYASDRLKDDEDLVLYAVNQYGESFQFASDRLKDDRNFVLKTINCDSISSKGASFKYASERLKNDKELAIVCVTQRGQLDSVIDKFKDDKDVVLAAVKVNGMALRNASKRLKDDEDIVKEAINNKVDAIKYASKRLQNDEKILKIINGG